MIRVDENFLRETGLGDLDEIQRTAFIEEAQRLLENRIGEKLSEGLSLEQLEEFDGIMKKDKNVMIKALAKLGDYRIDEVYQNLLKRYGVTEGTVDILSEYLSVKWIQTNRPNYAEVSRQVFEELKQEVRASSEEICKSMTLQIKNTLNTKFKSLERGIFGGRLGQNGVDYQSFEFWILEAQGGGGLFQVAVDKGFGIHRLLAGWLKLIDNEEITILARE